MLLSVLIGAALATELFVRWRKMSDGMTSKRNAELIKALEKEQRSITTAMQGRDDPPSWIESNLDRIAEITAEKTEVEKHQFRQGESWKWLVKLTDPRKEKRARKEGDKAD